MLDLGSGSIFNGVIGIGGSECSIWALPRFLKEYLVFFFFFQKKMDVFDFYFTFAVSCAVAYATGFDLNLISVFIWFSL